MSTKYVNTLAKHFDESDLITLLEAARVGLADADTFDMIAEDMDVSDKTLVSLRERLHEFMNHQ